ncbi:c-type cytochrome [Ferribacterium limneticum]|uniref:c-type cytochrome n=1 Tax=Ferribacterium limneticum TaxID=76259 RepID=UPI001CFC30BE|nr:c-type cytochrome [Ferribacterium limneticum]UCV29323.1 c-type cytochrome [Ferribacterium limneticum]UCV33242.1 c-type cytochrome [Ferribacterium limneticum]
MMRSFLVLAGLLVSTTLFAQPTAPERLKTLQADPAAQKAAVEAGKKAAFFCANCHGEDGISKAPEVPNLAGQNPAYLLEQIRKFGSGERKDQFMQGLIKVLKDEERVQIALYYANIAVSPSTADAAKVPHGKAVFAKLCVRCHGEQARGGELFPRLAGQKLPYLQTAITQYRDAKGIRSNQLMSIATSTLKNDDVTAVANYLTQLP